MAKRGPATEELPPGLVELSPPPDVPAAPARDDGSDVPAAQFWRCRVHLITHIEPGAPDHVVRAPDRANAEATFFAEMGIIGVDRTVNHFKVEPATELEFLRAQAKRLCVDLREHRAVPAGAKKSVKGVAEGLFPLTWQPPGGVEGKYVIDHEGNVQPAE